MPRGSAASSNSLPPTALAPSSHTRIPVPRCLPQVICYEDSRLLKLFAASAFLDGRTRVHEGDLFILRHTWNNLDQREILDDVVEPIIAQYYAEHPDDRPNQIAADLDRLVSELNLVDKTLTQGSELSDIQLFTQLRNLNDLRAAFAAHGGDTAQRMVKKIDALLEQVFEGGRFSAESSPPR